MGKNHHYIIYIISIFNQILQAKTREKRTTKSLHIKNENPHTLQS